MQFGEIKCFSSAVEGPQRTPISRCAQMICHRKTYTGFVDVLDITRRAICMKTHVYSSFSFQLEHRFETQANVWCYVSLFMKMAFKHRGYDFHMSMLLIILYGSSRFISFFSKQQSKTTLPKIYTFLPATYFLCTMLKLPAKSSACGEDTKTNQLYMLLRFRTKHMI